MDSEYSLVDETTNEDLFIADLQFKFPNLTEEELQDELDRELQNDALFFKKAEAIRAQYKQMEEQQRQEAIQATQQEQQALHQQTISELVSVAQDIDDLYSLELEDHDKEDVLQFLFAQDATGRSEWQKAQTDPRKLFEMAWFASKGKDAFDAIHDYYRKELERSRQANKASGRAPSAVVRKPAQPT